MDYDNFRKISAFHVYSKDGLDAAKITGIFHPNDDMSSISKANQIWAHEERENVCLLFSKEHEFTIEIGRKARYLVKPQDEQTWRLFTIEDEVGTQYFLKPHEDPDISALPHCVAVRGSRGLDGLYIKEASCRHGRVCYFHSVYSYRILWNLLKCMWEISTICPENRFTVHAKCYSRGMTPLSGHWIRSSFLAETFTVKPYELVDHVVGSTFVPAIPVLYFIDAWQRYQTSDVSKIENMIHFTKISKIPNEFTKPIKCFEEIRISIGLGRKDLKILITKSCILYSRLANIVVDFVGDQSLTLSIDNSEIRQVRGISVDQFKTFYKMDLRTLVKNICSRLNLHENVLKIFDQ